ncbi:hypothetical protein ABW19_dt0207660 [Dactylella cylindrospora]|nr:hypothetical protein ABW19_dt0207660 [Dactylella cylindrospora]
MSFFRKPTDDSSDDESDDDEYMSSSGSDTTGVVTADSKGPRPLDLDGSSSEVSDESDAEFSPQDLASSTSDISELIQPLSINAIANTIRKSDRLSISNRLHSIHEDSLFVQSVAEELGLPLIANERCGSWYVPPEKKGGSCYFKSTDGHFGCWSFSLRRLNLGLLEIIGKNAGCIIVDSTRRGKSIPDALSKTIPIWCAVMNSVLFSGRFDVELPDNAVSMSEAIQIGCLLDGFAQQLRELELETGRLAEMLHRPMKPVWITRDSNLWDSEYTGEDFYPVYLVSASKYLQKELQPRDSDVDGRNFVYIQGAGDDHEGWARGLLPVTYWKHHRQLLQAPEVDLPGLIDSIVTSQHAVKDNATLDGLSILRKLQGKIAICDINTYNTLTKVGFRVSGAIICSELGNKSENLLVSPAGPPTYRTAVPPNKHGSKLLRSKLHDIASFGERILSMDSSESGPLVVACDSGNDVSVGVALALICHLFDNQEKSTNGVNDLLSALAEYLVSTVIHRALTNCEQTIMNALKNAMAGLEGSEYLVIANGQGAVRADIVHISKENALMYVDTLESERESDLTIN